MKLIATEYFYIVCISTKSPDQHTKSLKRPVHGKYEKFKMAAKVINGHNFCSSADILMKLVAKYRFSHMSNSIKYIKITLRHIPMHKSKMATKMAAETIYGHNFFLGQISQWN